MFKAREVFRVLRELGFAQVRQVGSHVFFSHRDGRVTTIPVHGGKDLGRGLLKQILKDIKITPEVFLKML